MSEETSIKSQLNNKKEISQIHIKLPTKILNNIKKVALDNKSSTNKTIKVALIFFLRRYSKHFPEDT